VNLPNFPKTITVKTKENDSNRYFLGRDDYKSKVWNLLTKGLKSKGLDDLMRLHMLLGSSIFAHYKHFKDGSHLGMFGFSSEFMQVKVDIKFIGSEWGSGQIEEVTIHIIKCRVPKVVFT